MTKHPDIFAALAAPFEPHEVKKLPRGGRQLDYITARTAMNRLDDVLGPEGWWDEYRPAENSVLCLLTIRLPDGSTLTKADAGGYAGMADQGDDDKSGYSDAFKRACVKFGVARYLYRNGVPTFVREEPPAPEREPGWPPPGKGEAYDDDFSPQPREQARPAAATPKKTHTPQFKYVREMINSKVATYIGKCNRKLEEWGWSDRDRRDAMDFVNEFQVENELATRATSPEVGLIDPKAILGPNGKRDRRKMLAALQELYLERPGSVEATVEVYLGAKLAETLSLAEQGEIATQARR